MGTTFDDLIKQLHSGKGGAELADTEPTPVTVDSKRHFVIPENYNTILAYEGDVNSQIISFKLPRHHEGHDLSLCTFKALRWKNLSSNLEDWSTLTPYVPQSISKIEADSFLFLQWIIPPAAFATSGNLEIAITIYDLDNQNKIAFSWNTASFSGFKVEKTLSDVAHKGQISGYKAPAKNEILMIYEEGRNIVAPPEYNFVIANFGDINTSIVHFRTMQIVGGINLLDEDSEIKINVNLDFLKGQYPILKEDIFESFSTNSLGEKQVDFIWRVPPQITHNDINYIGAFSISVIFKNNASVWKTGTFSNLVIGDALTYGEDIDFSQEHYNVINGDKEIGDLTSLEFAGYVKARSHTGEITEKTEAYVNKNEMMPVYDEEGELVNVLVGSKDGQKLSEANDIWKVIKKHLDNGEAGGLGSGIYIGPGEMPDDYDVQVNPEGAAYKYELSDSEKAEITLAVGDSFSPSVEDLQEKTRILEAQVAALQKPRYEIVANEDQMLQEGVIYLLPIPDSEFYQEFLVVQIGLEKRAEPIGTTQVPLTDYATLNYVRNESQLYEHIVALRYMDAAGAAEGTGAAFVAFSIINNDPDSYAFDHNFSSSDYKKGKRMEALHCWALLRLYRALSTSLVAVKSSYTDEQKFLEEVGLYTTRYPGTGTNINISSSNQVRGSIDTIWAGYHNYSGVTTTGITAANRVLCITATDVTSGALDSMFKTIDCGATTFEGYDEKLFSSTYDEFLANEYKDGSGADGFCKHKLYCRDYVKPLRPFLQGGNI